MFALRFVFVVVLFLVVSIRVTLGVVEGGLADSPVGKLEEAQRAAAIDVDLFEGGGGVRDVDLPLLKSGDGLLELLGVDLELALGAVVELREELVEAEVVLDVVEEEAELSFLDVRGGAGVVGGVASGGGLVEGNADHLGDVDLSGLDAEVGLEAGGDLSKGELAGGVTVHAVEDAEALTLLLLVSLLGGELGGEGIPVDVLLGGGGGGLGSGGGSVFRGLVVVALGGRLDLDRLGVSALLDGGTLGVVFDSDGIGGLVIGGIRRASATHDF